VILGIDTSAAQCAVALLGAGDPVIERAAMERGHAEHLFPMIETVLSRAGTGYDALKKVAVCTGPGSFTGVRIGVAAARGLALGCGIAPVGISRFEALAAEARTSAPGKAVAVCLSGRGGMVYWQAFDADGAPMTEADISTEQEIAAAIPAECTRHAGDAAWHVAGGGALLTGGLPDPAVIARLSQGRENAPLPAPLYLRGADADLPREGPPRLLD
jgi:tRNA threonylcarbamoyl adenosine modification protein YeaZ